MITAWSPRQFARVSSTGGCICHGWAGATSAVLDRYSSIFAATSSNAFIPSAPSRRVASSCARRQRGKAFCKICAPCGVRETFWLALVLSSFTAIQPRRRIRCKLRLAVDLSIITTRHKSAALDGPCRLSFTRMPNCEIFSLSGPKASS